MVTVVDVDATWLNTPTYDAAEIRRADAIFLTTGIVRLSSTTLAPTVDGSDLVTVQPGTAVIPGTSGNGVYRAGIASAASASLDARDASNPRIDLVVFRVLDDDVVPTHDAYTGRVEIITGTPSATPVVPALPSMAVELGRISVPASGGGAATVDTTYRPFAAAAGGIIYAASLARLPTVVPAGTLGFALDAKALYIWDGVEWDAYLENRPKELSGTVTLTISATDTPVMQLVTFPAGVFSVAPRVTVSIINPSSNAPHFFSWGAHTVTTDDFTIIGVRTAGAAANMTLHWHAVAQG